MCIAWSANDTFWVRVVTLMVQRLLIFTLGTIVTLIYYALSVRKLRKIELPSLGQQDLNEMKLFLYPLVLFVTLLPSIVDDVLKLRPDSQDEFVFAALRMLLSHSLGLSNALVYGYQRKVFKSYKERTKTNIELRPESTESLNWELVRKNLE